MMNQLIYLARIQYRGPVTDSLDVLRGLQEAHLRRVPFENLDIWRGVPIELGAGYRKIVEAGRGGFCYELNGLFYELLRALGFTVKLVSARVYDGRKGEFGPEFDHMAIIARVAGADYLVDVGFGEFAGGPLAIHSEAVQRDARGDFLIERHDGQYLMVEKREGDKFEPEYLFTETARELEEFGAMCRYHQTSPESHFTQKRLCSMPTQEGRVTVSGNTLKITTPAGVREEELTSEAAFEEALQQYFNITL
jgi:N-hydroxyarylamine O-acetyltransferase